MPAFTLISDSDSEPFSYYLSFKSSKRVVLNIRQLKKGCHQLTPWLWASHSLDLCIFPPICCIERMAGCICQNYCDKWEALCSIINNKNVVTVFNESYYLMS